MQRHHRRRVAIALTLSLCLHALLLFVLPGALSRLPGNEEGHAPPYGAPGATPVSVSFQLPGAAERPFPQAQATGNDQPVAPTPPRPQPADSATSTPTASGDNTGNPSAPEHATPAAPSDDAPATDRQTAGAPAARAIDPRPPADGESTLENTRLAEVSGPASHPETSGADGQSTPAAGSRTVPRASSPPPSRPRPALIGKIEVEYPYAARAQGVEGTCVVEAHIDSEGAVSRVTVQHSSGSDLLDRAALRQVRRSHFRPRLLAGKPVAATTTVRVSFVLQEQ